MTKMLPAPSKGGSFPWGLLAQAVVLVVAVVREIVESRKK